MIFRLQFRENIRSVVNRVQHRCKCTSARLVLPNGIAYDQPVGLFVDNEFRESQTKFPTFCPATTQEIAQVFSASAVEVDHAVHAARSAFTAEWASLPGTERGQLLYRLSNLVEQNLELLGSIESWDTGKPLTASLTEDIPECVNVLRYYAGWADKIYGNTIQPFPEKFAYSLRQPIGVCGLIVPWNYPLMLSIWKLAPALAAGNTVVLKSSEHSPLSILYLAGLIKQAGFPPGTINIISGDGLIGKNLVQHSEISKISFTGSVVTGKSIMKLAADSLIPVTLELGGKSAAIIYADADLDQAVKWCHAGIMSNMGQICTGTSRIFVQETIHDEFMGKLKSYTAQKSKIGMPFDLNTFQGPQISKQQLDSIMGYINTALSEGANLVHGGKKIPGKGHFMEPTIFSNVKDKMAIVNEEIFGPVVTISSFTDSREVIRRANSTAYGLAAAVFTSDISRAMTVARRLDAGMVWINSSNDSDFRVPFGGFKQSGFGKELGDYAIKCYTQEKNVHVNLGTIL
ncbi:aldehyde dehydrogenase, partial [Lipomyces oligophaga]|uniref:aldehyde dehydrogenase n=1 Tax=Lipomyces oligophaga TaxID=45792 RepID=UPI0034CF30E6